MRLPTQLCRIVFCSLSLSLFVFVPKVLLAANKCKLPGEILIGEDKNYYYCSRKSCPELGAQLNGDKRALENLRNLIQGTSAELAHWTEENAKAQKQALEHAKEFLVETALSGFVQNRESKLDEIVRDIERANPIGTTWRAKVIKASNFERSYVRLRALILALKTVEYPGMDIESARADFKERAKAIGKETQVLAATWELLATDQDARQAFKERSFEFSVSSLKQTIRLPILSLGTRSASVRAGGLRIRCELNGSSAERGLSRIWRPMIRICTPNACFRDKCS